jgi:transposase
MANTIENDITQAISLLADALGIIRGAPEASGTQGRGRPRKSGGEHAAELYSRGLSVKEVAGKLGVSYPTARRMITGTGTSIRSTEERAAARRRATQHAA